MCVTLRCENGENGPDDFLDLIGFDSDIDEEDNIEEAVSVNEDIDSKEMNSCTVCRLLDTLTGEESDDDIYDTIWKTGSDNSGLVLVETETITDETCGMEISEEYQTVTSTIQTNSPEVVDPLSLSSEVSNSKLYPSIRYILPDGSFIKICVQLIKSNPILRQLTFPVGVEESSVTSIYVSENNLISTPNLWATLLKFAIWETFPDMTSTNEVNTLPTDKVMLGQSNVANKTPLEIQPKEIDEHFSTNHIVSSHTSNPSILLMDRPNTEGNITEMKFFLPDGSCKCIPLEQILDVDELKDYIKYSPNNPLTAEKYVTVEDLRENKSLNNLLSGIFCPLTTDRIRPDISEDENLFIGINNDENPQINKELFLSNPVETSNSTCNLRKDQSDETTFESAFDQKHMDAVEPHLENPFELHHSDGSVTKMFHNFRTISDELISVFQQCNNKILVKDVEVNTLLRGYVESLENASISNISSDEGQELPSTLCSTNDFKKKRQRRHTVRFFFPDGTCPRVNVKRFSWDKEVMELIQKPIQCKIITLELWNKMPTLQKLFPDYLKKYRQSAVNQNTYTTCSQPLFKHSNLIYLTSSEENKFDRPSMNSKENSECDWSFSSENRTETEQKESAKFLSRDQECCSSDKEQGMNTPDKVRFNIECPYERQGGGPEMEQNVNTAFNQPLFINSNLHTNMGNTDKDTCDVKEDTEFEVYSEFGRLQKYEEGGSSDEEQGILNRPMNMKCNEESYGKRQRRGGIRKTCKFHFPNGTHARINIARFSWDYEIMKFVQKPGKKVTLELWNKMPTLQKLFPFYLERCIQPVVERKVNIASNLPVFQSPNWIDQIRNKSEQIEEVSAMSDDYTKKRAPADSNEGKEDSEDGAETDDGQIDQYCETDSWWKDWVPEQYHMVNGIKKVNKIRFILPDGSVKHVNVSSFVNDIEVVSLLRRARQSSTRLKILVEDLRIYPTLRRLFPEYDLLKDFSHRQIYNFVYFEPPDGLCQSIEPALTLSWESSNSESKTCGTNSNTHLACVETNESDIPSSKELLVTLKDGGKALIKIKYLQWNEAFQRYCSRWKEFFELNGEKLLDDIPPPDNDTWDDDSEIWVPNPDSFFSVHTEIDNQHKWEQFLIKFGSSKTNPMSEKWREFIDLDVSETGKIKLVEKWRLFLLGERTQSHLTSTNEASQVSLSGSASSSLQEHVELVGPNSDLDNFINSSTVTTVHGPPTDEQSLESFINSSTVTTVYNSAEQIVQNPSPVTTVNSEPPGIVKGPQTDRWKNWVPESYRMECGKRVPRMWRFTLPDLSVKSVKIHTFVNDVEIMSWIRRAKEINSDSKIGIEDLRNCPSLVKLFPELQCLLKWIPDKQPFSGSSHKLQGTVVSNFMPNPSQNKSITKPKENQNIVSVFLPDWGRMVVDTRCTPLVYL